MPKPKPCKRDGCNEPKVPPAHFCYWHDLERSFIDDQVSAAKRRRAKFDKSGAPSRKTVPASAWPEGRRFCAGCQSMVPIWYCAGKSRCRACESAAAYDGHLRRTYGITYAQYLAIYEAQDGMCYICEKKPKTIRLAVDHDHATGAVRGLLCTGTRSCNHDVLGNIADLATAKRIVQYLEKPPAMMVLTADGRGIKPVSKDPYKYPDGDWLRWPVWEARYAATGAADAWSLERALPDAISCTAEIMQTFLARDRLKTGLTIIPQDEWERIFREAAQNPTQD
jgi:hypothetical protein